MTQGKALLEAAEHLDELLPVESAHLHIRQIVERREESARIVGHLHEVRQIDDMLLADTDKGRVERHNHVARHVSLQSDGLVESRDVHLPYSRTVLISNDADVANVHKAEVYGIGIDKELAVRASSDAVRTHRHCIGGIV